MVITKKLKYKLCYQNLKLYLSLGLKIKNCRILELLNKNHFWSNILNTIQICEEEQKRKGKKIKKQKTKLRSNAIFGKLIENPMNKIDVRIDVANKH